jgi:hypothetical protein
MINLFHRRPSKGKDSMESRSYGDPLLNPYQKT